MADQILNYSTIEGYIKEVEGINSDIYYALEVSDKIHFALLNETDKGIYFGQAVDEIQEYASKMHENISELLGYMELVKSYMMLVEETVKKEDESLSETYSSAEYVEV